MEDFWLKAIRIAFAVNGALVEVGFQVTRASRQHGLFEEGLKDLSEST
jgi:hypothetical protein